LSKEEDEQNKILAEIEEKRQKMQEKLTANETENARIRKATEDMKVRLDKAESLISEREAKKMEREKEGLERKALIVEHEKICAEIARVTETIDTDKHAIVEYEKSIIEMKTRKETNDKLEAEKILPGRAELLELKEEKHKLDAFLQNITTEFSTEKEQLQEGVLANKSTIDHLELELKEVLQKIEEKKSVIAEHQRIVDDHNDAIQKELNALELRKNEQIQLNEDLELKIATKSAELKKREDDEEYQFQEIKRKHEVLRHGQKLLQKTAAKEQKILNGKASDIIRKQKKKV
jgi:hypothetical protein